MTDTPPANTALLLIDLQNDFLHPAGAYGRAGVGSETIRALPPRIKPVADALRAAGGWIISSHFTLVPGKQEPFISPHLKSLRPFLGRGDFAPGSFGHALVDELQPADLSVEKIAYSAFYMTRLDWLLRRAGIRQLLVAGIVSNGGVASTVRDAQVRDYPVTVLEDGCAAFSDEVHATAIEGLRGVASVSRCAAECARLSGR